jgi:hypothetical protein
VFLYLMQEANDVEEAKQKLMKEQAEVERACAEFEREQNEFLIAVEAANKEAAEAQQARTEMQDALAAFKAAAADPYAEESHLTELQQRYIAAKEVFEREAAEAQAASEVAAQEQAEAEAAKSRKEQEEQDVAEANAALQREVEEASCASIAFQQVTLFLNAT